METFNEMSNYIITCLILNLGTIPGGENLYNHGLQVNYIIMGMFGVNVLFVFKSILWGLKQSIHRKIVYWNGKIKLDKLAKKGSTQE
jgi:hypothetical protein